MNNHSFCDIYLIRHGETDWNANRKLQGHTDIPLNQQGIEQAENLKEKLGQVNFSAVYTSDLIRAKTTASIVIGTRNLPISENPALREGNMGRWEGHLIEDLNAYMKQNQPNNLQDPQVHLKYKAHEQMESYSEIYERVDQFIKNKVSEYVGKTILLSSHGGVLRTMLLHLEYKPGVKCQISNCAYIKFRVSDTGKYMILDSDGITY